MRIFLIGFMGSGKTTVGKALAELLSLEFFDLDTEIEKECRATINVLFEKKGESYFRDVEHKVLKRLTEKTEHIIATGGGTPCFSDNMKMMNEQGTTIYLRCSAGVLFQRLVREKQVRPLIKDRSEKELLSYIIKKLDERERWYLMAKQIIDVDDTDPRIISERMRRGMLKK